MNQSETFISAREFGAIKWISIDEVNHMYSYDEKFYCKLTLEEKEKRLKLAKLIWSKNNENNI